MKKVFILISAAVFVISLLSCDDNVSPKGNLPVKYSVNLILRGDTTFQVAYISQLYDVEGFDPLLQKSDPAFQNAQLYVKYSDSSQRFYFNDTTEQNKINQRYGTPAKYYYLKNWKPNYGKDIEMVAEFPDGKKLISKTKSAGIVTFDIYNSTPFIPGPLIGRDTTYITAAWENSGLDNLKAKKVSLVYYYKDLSGIKKRFEKIVPIQTLTGFQRLERDYSQVSYKNEIKLERKLLFEALKEISAGDAAKGRYSIAPLEIQVFSFDDNLTKLFSSGLYFDYGFTLQNYPSDFSNVNGGFGFFGCYTSTKKTIMFETQYLKINFGYLTEENQ